MIRWRNEVRSSSRPLRSHLTSLNSPPALKIPRNVCRIVIVATATDRFMPDQEFVALSGGSAGSQRKVRRRHDDGLRGDVKEVTDDDKRARFAREDSGRRR
jgi:hypothetical protein